MTSGEPAKTLSGAASSIWPRAGSWPWAALKSEPHRGAKPGHDLILKAGPESREKWLVAIRPNKVFESDFNNAPRPQPNPWPAYLDKPCDYEDFKFGLAHSPETMPNHWRSGLEESPTHVGFELGPTHDPKARMKTAQAKGSSPKTSRPANPVRPPLPPPLRLPGVVLARNPRRESDIMATLVTREKGLVSALAKNARQSVRRFGGGLLSPGAVAWYHLRRRPGSPIWFLDKAEPNNRAPVPPPDPIAKALAAWALELVRTFEARDNPAPNSFNLLLRHLSDLAKLADYAPPALAARALSLAFTKLYLELAGFGPDLSGCVICGRVSATTWRFDPSSRGLLCPDCAKISNRRAAQSPAALVETLKAIKSHDDAPAFSDDWTKTAEAFFQKLATLESGRSFKSPGVLRQLLSEAPSSFASPRASLKVTAENEHLLLDENENRLLSANCRPPAIEGIAPTSKERLSDPGVMIGESEIADESSLSTSGGQAATLPFGVDSKEADESGEPAPGHSTIDSKDADESGEPAPGHSTSEAKISGEHIEPAPEPFHGEAEDADESDEAAEAQSSENAAGLAPSETGKSW